MNAMQGKLDKLCKDNHVKVLYVFGSRASETTELLIGTIHSLSKNARDLDIAILTTSAFSIDEKVKFAIQLEEIFDVLRVDLVVLNNADPFVAANVVRGNRLYAHDSYEADEYELFVLRRAGDLAGFERERIALVLRDTK